MRKTRIVMHHGSALISAEPSVSLAGHVGKPRRALLVLGQPDADVDPAGLKLRVVHARQATGGERTLLSLPGARHLGRRAARAGQDAA
jgi:hypothetical protein